jgi:hypothetical protein
MNTLTETNKRSDLMSGRNGLVPILCFLALSVGAFSQTSLHDQVSYQNSHPPRLTVVAHGSSLAGILEEIHAKTGIVFVGNGPKERISGQFGPGIPREVIQKLLANTRSSYTMESCGTPYSLTKVVFRTPSDKNPMTASTAKNESPRNSELRSPAPSATAAVVDNAGQQKPAASLVASPDGSPYVGKSAVSVQQLHERMRQAKKQQSERLSQEQNEEHSPSQ